MTALVDTSVAVNLELISPSAAIAKYPASVDPFRHSSINNSHNHHGLHPWGENIIPQSKEFDALYAQANNQYMYHLWYKPELRPYMATDVLSIQPFNESLMKALVAVVQQTLSKGLDAAIASNDGVLLKSIVQSILDKANVSSSDQIFIRLGATSAKDSWAVNTPTAKPPPLSPNPDSIVRRLLTSGRVVGRILALYDKIWPEDPGESFVIERWTSKIELKREFRVFCYKGRVTAVSQDIWWEDLGWRGEHLPGFVEAITTLWSKIKDYLPFDTCTMDVNMTKDAAGAWKASLIEFNGFGGHLNTGSDLFHWVNDADILHGKQKGITVRFVSSEGDNQVIEHIEEAINTDDTDEEMPDWLALETKIRERDRRETA